MATVTSLFQAANATGQLSRNCYDSMRPSCGQCHRSAVESRSQRQTALCGRNQVKNRRFPALEASRFEHASGAEGQMTVPELGGLLIAE
jgi:hypothetical protein